MDLETTRVEVDDDRFYLIEGDYYPSVTTILSMYNPQPYGLMKFHANKGWYQAKKIKHHSQKVGSLIHETIDEILLEGESVDYDDFTLEEWNYLIGFKNFADKHELETENKEARLCSHEHEYAGTLDWEGFVNGDKYVRIDWKTSNSIYEKNKLQLVAYEMARREMGARPADELWLIQLDSGTKQKYSKRKVTDVEERFEIFKYTQALWSYANKGRPTKKSVPARISINI